MKDLTPLNETFEREISGDIGHNFQSKFIIEWSEVWTMNYEIVQLEEKALAGLKIRTSNHGGHHG